MYVTMPIDKLQIEKFQILIKGFSVHVMYMHFDYRIKHDIIFIAYCIFFVYKTGIFYLI